MVSPVIADWNSTDQAISLALSDNTRIAYRKGWSRFTEFCASEGIVDPLSASPESVARYFVNLSTRPSPRSGIVPSMGTVTIYKSALARKFTDAGKPSPTNHPTVKATLKGLARLKGAPIRRVDALREYHIAAMIEACPETTIGCRDAAIIAVGFAAALRRSEICSLRVEDIDLIDHDGHGVDRMIITVRRSKTDQQGRGQKVAVLNGHSIRPVDCLLTWLSSSGIVGGHLFQTMKRGGNLRGKPLHHSDIPRIVKHYAAAIGLDPSGISGHSLRAGFVTSAAVHRARIDKIMEITRHTSPATVMQYIRDADAFSDHAGQDFL